jgi:hypothetical protein
VNSAAFWWNACGLFLVLTWILQRPMRGWKGLVLATVVAAALSVIPWFGHVPRSWLSGLTPNVSIPMFLLLLVAVAQRAGFPAVFRAREWRAAWIFGTVAAWALYPSALGLAWPGIDTYGLGWPWLEWDRSVWFFGPVALLAAFLLWRGNRFGWFLVAAAVLYQLGLQESRNFWDYLVDPLYAAVSLLAVTIMTMRRLMRR